MAQRIAYLNGRFLPAEQLVISRQDLGFTLGVTVSERLRTFQGQLFRLTEHIDRLRNSLDEVGLAGQVDFGELALAARRVAQWNYARIEPDNDLGLSIFVTPGIPEREQPTIGIEAERLPFFQWVRWYDEGLSLVETGIRQVPPNCWPPALKCRCRIHYYRADRLADQRRPGARAIFLDQQGFVTESSTANILIYRRDEGLVSPPREKILPGVSLAVVVQLARQSAIPITYRDLLPADVLAADEVMMCSTSPCLWTVSHWNDRPVGAGPDGKIYRRLLSGWNRLVGLDIVEQARRYAH